MAKLLDSDESESEDGGAQIARNPTFTVNEDFARRFTHNKKREELHRCE
jgi:protein KRI1